MTRALLIMGPTASGKSALGLALAERLDGEIVNADSMQVYRDLRVLSARPSPEEEARAAHHLFGHVDAGERYSTGRWLADAAQAIAAIQARGRRPILVGGTGLYFKALTEGLAPAPPGTPAIRARLNAELAAIGAAGLHARLAALDSAAGERIRPSDPARIVRALEVHESGGQIAALTQKEAPLLTEWRGFVLAPERAALYRAIEARFDQMLAAGALEEARALAARGLDPDLPAVKAHGLPPLSAHLRGEIGLEEAAARAKQDTRRYAKRQFTWINHQNAGWIRIEAAGLEERIGQVLARL
ncbi:MAG: tRNA (adenosine(37)-N6)-dimethylallyltransferase MiaA [Hyphomonadaceae bacterium]